MATAASTKTPPRLEAILEFPTQAIAAAKTTGTATLDKYEATIGALAAYQKQAAAKSPVGFVGGLVDIQADLLVALGKKSTAPARYLLK